MGNAAHLQLLKDLARTGTRFVVWGSAALLLRDPGLSLELHDVDVLLLPGELRAFATWALRRGEVRCWGEPWLAEWDERQLAGRFYVRAHIDGLQLDATFEEPDFDVTTLYARATWIDGVPVCPEAELQATRRRKLTSASR